MEYHKQAIVVGVVLIVVMNSALAEGKETIDRPHFHAEFDGSLLAVQDGEDVGAVPPQHRKQSHRREEDPDGSTRTASEGQSR